MQFCCNFMWTISLVCGIMLHEVIESFLLLGIRGNSILTELNHFFYPFLPFSLTSIVTLQVYNQIFLKSVDFIDNPVRCYQRLTGCSADTSILRTSALILYIVFWCLSIETAKKPRAWIKFLKSVQGCKGLTSFCILDFFLFSSVFSRFLAIS